MVSSGYTFCQERKHIVDILAAFSIASFLVGVKAEIKNAVPGEVVVGPTIKGLKLFGRRVSFPLNIQVEK